MPKNGANAERIDEGPQVRDGTLLRRWCFPRRVALSTRGSPDTGLCALVGAAFTYRAASSPAKRWSTIVSRDHGWREFNTSHNGLGFIRNRSLFGTGDRPDLIIEQHPNTVFITLGLNDIITCVDSADAIPAQTGDNTPRIINDWGQQSCRARQATTLPVHTVWAYEESNGDCGVHDAEEVVVCAGVRAGGVEQVLA